MLKPIALLLAVSIFFTQCAPLQISQPYQAPIAYDAFSNLACLQPPPQVYVFHSGEPLDFEFKRLGQLHYDGPDGRGGISALEFMQYEARKKCANGIIVTKESIRNVPVRYDTLNGNIENKEYITLRAVAIDIKTDSAFFARNGRTSQAALFRKISNQMETVPNPEPDPVREFANGMLTFVAVIGLLALAVTAGDE